MPRIPRLRRPLGLPASCRAARGQPMPRFAHRQPYHATASRPATTTTTTAARPWSSRNGPLSSARLFRTSAVHASAEPTKTNTAVEDAAAAAPDVRSLEAELVEAEAEAALSHTSASASGEPLLVVPGTVITAPRPGQIGDATYVPAETGEGLEQLGGLDDWWEDDRHWDPAVEFRGFGPARHVTDPAVLEVLARQAVLEALAVQAAAPAGGDGAPTLTSAWRRGGQTAQRAALALDVEVAADGRVTAVQGDAAAVVAGLGLGAEKEAKKATEATQPLDVDEARALLESFDDHWKSVSLAEPALKFAVNKRILQLTGHLLPDAQLASADTAGALLAVLVRPPKAKTLAQELQADGTLASLPNVSVYERRVTPIDKHKMVGRWKVIVEELEKRELPVTGTGKHDKSVERRWAYY